MKREREIRQQTDLPGEYQLRRQPRSGHYEIVKPDGSLLRMPSGLPLTLAFSPSDYRANRNARAAIRKALAADAEARHTSAPTEGERPAGASLSTSATKETRPGRERSHDQEVSRERG